MKKYPLLYFTNIIWIVLLWNHFKKKKIHFQLEQNIYKRTAL